ASISLRPFHRFCIEFNSRQSHPISSPLKFHRGTLTMALSIAKSPLLGPVLALNGWTFIMEIWLYAKRIPAVHRATEQGKLNVGPSITKEGEFFVLGPEAVQFNHDPLR